MNTTTKYTNSLGEEITLQQASLLNDYYYLNHYLDGELKRIDHYDRNNIPFSGTYFMENGENIMDLLVQFKEIWEDGLFYINKQIVGNYIVRDWEVYKGLTKVDVGKSVFDNEGREIATQFLDINSLSIRYTTKIYYLSFLGSFNNKDDIQNFGTFEFTYDLESVNGISVEVNLLGFNHKSYYISNQENILNHPLITPIFSWNDHPYYHGASPLVPNVNA